MSDRKIAVMKNDKGESLLIVPTCECTETHNTLIKLQMYDCPEGRFSWDGNFESPTINGSVGYHIPHKDGTPRCGCHFFVRNGCAEHCGDSKYAGHPPIPLKSMEWYHEGVENNRRLGVAE